MDQNQTSGTDNTVVTPGTENEAVVVNTPLEIVIGDNVTKLEMNGIVSETPADKEAVIRGYIRSKVLKQFGVVEVAKTPVTAGKLYFNDGVRTSLKLPKVKETKSGAFAESLEAYYTRVKPEIRTWMVKSFQNASLTQAIVESLN